MNKYIYYKHKFLNNFMNSFFPFLDIIILGLLALFLGFRLKNLLGDRSGYGEDVNNL